MKIKVNLLILICFSLSCSTLYTVDWSKMYDEVPNLHVDDEVVLNNSPYNNLIRKTFKNKSSFIVLNDEIDERKHYLNILDLGDDALLARIHLIRSAKKSICLQTFIWKNDASGRYVIKELINAAKRGVKVKIIIDQVGSTNDLDLIAYLANAHQNLQLKFYNPSSERINSSALNLIEEIAFKFKEINQRMHNKVIIFDDRIAITGGRNYQDDYFDRNPIRNFKDRDVLVVGPVVRTMTESFAKYWAFKWSVNAKNLIDVNKTIKIMKEKDVKYDENFNFGKLFKDIEVDASDYEYIKKRFVDNALSVKKVMFVYDNPGKNKSKSLKGLGNAVIRLAEILSEAKHSIIAQTPYLVLDKFSIKSVKELRKKNPDIDIIISTNSLAATDNIYAYSYAFKQKKIFVKNLRFRVFEFKPVPKDISSLMKFYNKEKEKNSKDLKSIMKIDKVIDGLTLSPKEKHLCIHAKSFVVDDEIAWIGSFNFDPRSIHLNTEVGLFIWDKKVAKALKESIQKDISPGNSWTVAKAKNVPLISFFSGLIGSIMEKIPIIDVWPFQYTSLFELKKGKREVPFYDKEFYENYKEVGSYPEVGLSLRQIQLRLIKAFVGVAEPII